MNVAYHQHNKDRVQFPLKKVGDRFERITWDQAIREISERLKGILDQYGPRTLAALVGGGEFSFLSMPFPIRLVRRLGSRYNYSAANQEFAGRSWAHGLTLGRQNIQMESDFENCNMLMLIGKNPMMSHHFAQARRRLTKISKDPGRLLVVVDPRVSETAGIADIHLAIRPGADALLIKSMISIILDEGIYNQKYIDKHTDGFSGKCKSPEFCHSENTWKCNGLGLFGQHLPFYNMEVNDWIKKINPVDEEEQLKSDERFPLILMAGRHIDVNANTGMRDPAWNRGKRACTLAINPSDAEALGIVDKQMARVITEAGAEEIEAEVTTDARKGQVIIPHGFGLVYDGVKYGVNVNRLTKNTNRDFVGTPMHRYAPCRVEAIG